ncbi:MAG: hypothetical protein JW717_04320 [Marinilabiliaceae bacterium]|nr:hypothetical protein [Marinilabiliaceae bacterium]MBN2819091.1 hypothetical protein [Bacteroidales bacterium]
MERKLIMFKEKEYQIFVNQSKSKLKAWNNVVEQIGYLIKIPTTKKQYELMMNNPLEYVTKAIESEHRPNINLPIRTEKLLELLEVDLNPLREAVKEYNKYSGELACISPNEVAFIVVEEEFNVYAETEKELNRLEASEKLIEAYNNLMKLEDKDFPKYSNHKLHELKQATGNLIRWENSQLVPNAHWVRQN